MKIKLLLVFFVFSFLFKTDYSFDQDLGRHIKLGEIITQGLQVPNTNLFSYTNPDFPFINTHWGFEVFSFLFTKNFGLPAFLILKVFIILLSVWLTLRIIPKGNTALLLPVGFIFLHVLRERTDLRPEIFSFLFVPATVPLYWMFQAERNRTSIHGIQEAQIRAFQILELEIIPFRLLTLKAARQLFRLTLQK